MLPNASPGGVVIVDLEGTDCPKEMHVRYFSEYSYLLREILA